MPENQKLLLAAAEKALSEGRLDQVVGHCRKALELGPSDDASIALGIALYRLGRMDEAVFALERCDASAEARLWRSRALRRLGRREEALESAERSLDLNPSDSSALHHAGLCFMELDRLPEAVASFRRAIELDREVATLHHGLGLAMLRAGDIGGAIEALQRAIELEPGSPRILAALQTAMAQRTIAEPHQAESGLEAARTHADRNPWSSEAWQRLGFAYLDDLRYEDAIRSLERAAELGGGRSELHQNLAEAYVKVEDYRKAAQSFRKALKLGEFTDYLRRRLVEALFDIPDIPAALKEVERFVLEAPNSFEAQTALSQCHLLMGQTDLANEAMDAAIRIGAADGPQAFRLATLLRSLGRIAEAERCLNDSITMQPVQGAAYALLAYMRKSQPDDRRRIEVMESLADRADLPLSHRSLLEYGLGKAFEDLREYETAIGHYDQANLLAYSQKFGAAEYDRSSFVDFHERAPAVLRPWLESAPKIRASESDAPIFVFGTMRSGTTLMDQILSSHPSVGSVGEHIFWANRAAPFVRPHAEKLREADIERMGGEYLAEVRPMVGSVPRFVDKMPANYGCAPLIHLAMPRAKLVHMVRTPADVCLSIYTTINHARIQWAHDKRNIAFAYNEYAELMREWRALIPRESMIEIAYEDLISNTEEVLRGLLEWLGLEWNEACLHPEKNQRSVLTPSAWQVRQPINSGSIERWKRFAPWIGEFIDLRKP